jgi:hypothetical protein
MKIDSLETIVVSQMLDNGKRLLIRNFGTILRYLAMRRGAA